MIHCDDFSPCLSKLDICGPVVVTERNIYVAERIESSPIKADILPEGI